MLTDRYLDGIPEDSRAAREGSLSKSMLSEENLERIRALNEIAQRRGQTLAQLALAWTLRDPRVTSTLIGASSVAQLEDNVGALGAPGLRRRRAGRDRPVRGRRRDQHLGAVELGLRSAALRGANSITEGGVRRSRASSSSGACVGGAIARVRNSFGDAGAKVGSAGVREGRRFRPRRCPQQAELFDTPAPRGPPAEALPSEDSAVSAAQRDVKRLRSSKRLRGGATRPPWWS